MQEQRRLAGIAGFAAFSPTWRYVAGRTLDPSERGTGRVVGVWDVEQGQQRWLLRGHTDTVRGAAFSPDGRMLVSAGGRDRSVRLWDMESGEQVQQMEGHTSTVAAVAFSPDGKLVASGSLSETDWGERTVRVWDVENGRERACFDEGRDTITVLFHPHNHVLASAGKSSDVRLRHVHTGNEERLIHRGGQGSFAFAPDWGTLASVGLDDPSLLLWDVTSGQQLHRLERARDFFSGVAYSPDGRLLASGGKYLQVWDAERGVEVRRLALERVEWLAGFSPDRQTIALLNPDGVLCFLAVGSDEALAQAEQELALTIAQQKEWHAAGRCIACGQPLSWKDKLFRHLTCGACRAKTAQP